MMIGRLVRGPLLVAIVLAFAAPAAWAVTVVRPLSLNGFYDLSHSPHHRSATALIDLGIEFTEISSVGLRIEAVVTAGLTKDLSSGLVEPFPPLVTATLLGDQGGTAFGEVLLPNEYDEVLLLNNAGLPVIPNYSPLLDGKAALKLGVDVPLMTANVAILDYPAVNVEAAAAIVTGQSQGRLAGDFDGDGVVFVEDYAMFKRTFGQHVIPGTGADANGDGIVNAADYGSWRDHLGASIRPTDGYLAGDFDYSGAVDAADYFFWKARFGERAAPFSGADGDGDGLINAADYSVWRNQFGRSLPGYSLAAAPVPEPAAILLLASAVAALPVFRRRLA